MKIDMPFSWMKQNSKLIKWKLNDYSFKKNGKKILKMQKGNIIINQ